MPGCSTSPIGSPQGWPKTARANRSTSRKPDTTFAIARKGRYSIEGPAFIYSDRDTGRTITILGYPTDKLAQMA
jgi:hypothetical protein